MEKLTQLVLIFVASLTIASCSTENTLEIPADLREAKIQAAKAFVSNVQFKFQVTPINGQALRKIFRVSLSDMQSLLTTTGKSAARSAIVRNIEPVVYNGDTINIFFKKMQIACKLFGICAFNL